MKTKSKKGGDETIRVRDTGKKKVTVKTSDMQNDSASNYSYSKVVEKPKKGVLKSKTNNFSYSSDSNQNFITKDSTLFKKESPKRSYISSSISSRADGQTVPYRGIDSSYVQKLRKPTEKREGREVIKIKKRDSDSPYIIPVVKIKTVKKIPKLTSKKK
jgi:hypothetical protein